MWDFKRANSQKQKIDGGYQGLGAKKKWRYWMKGTKFHCSMLYAGQIPSRNLMAAVSIAVMHTHLKSAKRNCKCSYNIKT